MDQMSFIGSDELTQKELEEQEALRDKLTKQLEQTAKVSVEAKQFLSTSFGKQIREVIYTNKANALELCATNTGEALETAQYDYRVWQMVEQVFAVIIKGGDEALVELQKMRVE